MPSKKSVPILVGNWKMYKTGQEAYSYVKTLAPVVKKSQAEVYLAVPFTAIAATAKSSAESNSGIKVGAQNMHDATEGAFTGEIAASMLKEAGAQFVLLGHSERRHLFKETSQFVNKKIKKALQEEIQPIVCVGETQEEHHSGKREQILEEQILQSLEGLEANVFKTLLLAYEPVWAIGTGKVATPKDAESAHLFCRKIIGGHWGKRAGNAVRILYGGSVKAENAGQLLNNSEINGLLVGGASLDPEGFAKIITITEQVT